MLKCSRVLPRLSNIANASLKPASTRTLSRIANVGARTVVRRKSPTTINEREYALSKRWYSQDNAPPKETPEAQEAQPNKVEDIPSERFVQVLENTAAAPWLHQVPLDPADRLKRAYTLLFQIILYLGRPQEPEKAEQFLVAFESAPVSATSEIGRARNASARILRAVVQDISSIPMSSPLRTEHTELFAIFGALLPLHDLHLSSKEGEVTDWREFWGHAQPIVLQLAMKLDDDGYGMKLEDEQEN